jgi:hypothetical protein
MLGKAAWQLVRSVASSSLPRVSIPIVPHGIFDGTEQVFGRRLRLDAGKPAMFNIHQILPGQPPQLFVVDVGAASMGEGSDPYHQLAALPTTHVIGFEPNVQTCE